MPAITITRKQLYDRVWTESLMHVAFSLGLWPNRLAKVCTKHDIPTPDRGYWYCATADREKLREPLPNPDQDVIISITPSKPGPPKPDRESATVPRIVVPARLARSHRLIREARAASSNSVDEYGLIRLPAGCLDIRVSPANQKRAFRIMNTLEKACEARDWSVTVPSGYRAGTIVTIDGCEVRVELIEGLRQEPRELDEWEKKLGFNQNRKRPPYRLVPTGRLTIRVRGEHTWWNSGQWRDGIRRRLEDMLDDVVAGILAVWEGKIQHNKAAAAAEERRLEQARLQMEEAERQRQLEEIRRAEQARVDELLADAESWHQSRVLSAYIDAWIAKVVELTGEKVQAECAVAKWVAWAKEQALRLDPLASLKMPVDDGP